MNSERFRKERVGISIKTSEVNKKIILEGAQKKGMTLKDFVLTSTNYFIKNSTK